MQLNKKEPIYWCKMGMGDDKKNPMALKQKAIGPSGQVVEISMASGKTIVSWVGNAYADIIKREKLRRDWVWYVDCPKEKNKCYAGPMFGKNRRSKDAEFCVACMEREELIRTRTEMKNASNAENAAAYETRLDKLARLMEATMINNIPAPITDAQLTAAMAADVPAAATSTPEKKTPKPRGANVR